MFPTFVPCLFSFSKLLTRAVELFLNLPFPTAGQGEFIDCHESLSAFLDIYLFLDGRDDGFGLDAMPYQLPLLPQDAQQGIGDVACHHQTDYTRPATPDALEAMQEKIYYSRPAEHSGKQQSTRYGNQPPAQFPL